MESRIEASGSKPKPKSGGQAVDVDAGGRDRRPATKQPTRTSAERSIAAEVEAKVDAALLKKLHGDPDEMLHCIVMAEESLEALESEMPSSLLVEHRYSLIQGISVTGSAGAILELSRLPSVKSIESVRPVSPC